jgi:hypothetical protein
MKYMNMKKIQPRTMRRVMIYQKKETTYPESFLKMDKIDRLVLMEGLVKWRSPTQKEKKIMPPEAREVTEILVMNITNKMMKLRAKHKLGKAIDIMAEDIDNTVLMELKQEETLTRKMEKKKEIRSNERMITTNLLEILNPSNWPEPGEVWPEQTLTREIALEWVTAILMTMMKNEETKQQ